MEVPADPFAAKAMEAPAAAAPPVETGPRRAKLLGKKFKNDNKVYVYNLASQQHLRIKRFFKAVDGAGADKEYSQFYIEKVGLDRIRLRNVGYGTTYVVVNSPTDLNFSDNATTNSEFFVVKHGRYGGKTSEPVYSLESCAYPGTYVGFDQKGNAKAPNKAGLGLDGQFYFRVKN